MFASFVWEKKGQTVGGETEDFLWESYEMLRKTHLVLNTACNVYLDLFVAFAIARIFAGRRVGGNLKKKRAETLSNREETAMPGTI